MPWFISKDSISHVVWVACFVLQNDGMGHFTNISGRHISKGMGIIVRLCLEDIKQAILISDNVIYISFKEDRCFCDCVEILSDDVTEALFEAVSVDVSQAVAKAMYSSCV